MTAKRGGKAKVTANDVAKWAAVTAGGKGGAVCAICHGPKEVQEAVKTVATMRHNGESHVSQEQMVLFLRDRMNFKVCATSLSRHIRMHLNLVWGRN